MIDHEFQRSDNPRTKGCVRCGRARDQHPQRCTVCDELVTGPCTPPVDMGGGMIDTPCGVEGLYVPAEVPR